MSYRAAKNAKKHFEQLLKMTLKGAIPLNKKSKIETVMLSLKSYKNLEKIEENSLILKAKMVLKEGFIGVEESENFLKILCPQEE